MAILAYTNVQKYKWQLAMAILKPDIKIDEIKLLALAILIKSAAKNSYKWLSQASCGIAVKTIFVSIKRKILEICIYS